MGRFVYGKGDEVLVFDDRTLAHLQMAMEVKLRRGESFMFTVSGRHMPSGQGGCSLWIAPPIPVVFEYRKPHARRAINHAWVEALVSEASRAEGLHIVPEPDDPICNPLAGIDAAPHA